jgi:hypothetical protein
MRNNDITDTRAKLAAYVKSGLITLPANSAIPQITRGVRDDE